MLGSKVLRRGGVRVLSVVEGVLGSKVLRRGGVRI